MRNISQGPDEFQAAWRRLNRTWRRVVQRRDNPVSRELDRYFWAKLVRESEGTLEVMVDVAKLIADVRRRAQ